MLRLGTLKERARDCRCDATRVRRICLTSERLVQGRATCCRWLVTGENSVIAWGPASYRQTIGRRTPSRRPVQAFPRALIYRGYTVPYSSRLVV